MQDGIANAMLDSMERMLERIDAVLIGVDEINRLTTRVIDNTMTVIDLQMRRVDALEELVRRMSATRLH